MKIETGTIQTVKIEFTEPEARAFLVDPRPIQDAVRESLSYSIVSQRANEGRDAATPRRAVGGKRKGRRPLDGGLPAEKIPCPICGKPITNSPKGRGTHFGKAHPGVTPNDVEWNAPAAD